MVPSHEGVVVGLLELGERVVDMTVACFISTHVQQQVTHSSILHSAHAFDVRSQLVF